MSPSNTFPLTTGIWTGVLCAGLAAAAWGMGLNHAVVQGIGIGGVAALAVLITIAWQARRLAILPPDKVNSAVYVWSLIRYPIYGISLYQAYTLDPAKGHGVLGALAGLMSLQAVVLIRGVACAIRSRKEP